MADLNFNGIDDTQEFNNPTITAPVAPVAPPAPTAPPPLQTAQVTTTSPTVTTKAPESTVTNYGAQTSVKGKQQTPEEIRLLGEQNKLDENAISIIQKKGELDKAKADILEKQAAENFLRAQEKEKVQNEVMQKAEVDIKNRTSEYDKRYSDYKNMKINDFWDDKSTGTKILAALFTGLGTLGSAMTGGKVENTAFKIIENAIDKDFNKQKANILQAKDTVGFAKEGIDIARSNKAEALRDLELKRAAAAEVVANKYAEMLAKQGKPAAEIEQDLNLQKLRQEAQNRLMEVQKDLRKDVTTEAARQVTVNTSGGQTTTSGGTTVIKKAPEGRDYKNEIELRKEFNSLPEVKDFKTVKTAYEKIKGAPLTAAGDMSLIYSYMKMNDPGSTVREGEFATAESTDGTFQRLQQLYKKAMTGERLSEKQRKEFTESSKSLMAAQKLGVDKANKEYSTIAKQYGAEPSRVVTLDLTDEPKEEKKTETPGVFKEIKGVKYKQLPDGNWEEQ